MIFNSNLFAIQNHISEFILSKLSRERMEKRVLVESDGLRRSSALSRRGGLWFLPVCQYIVLSLFLRSGCFRVLFVVWWLTWFSGTEVLHSGRVLILDAGNSGTVPLRPVIYAPISWCGCELCRVPFCWVMAFSFGSQASTSGG